MRVKNESQTKESKDLFKNEPTNIKGIPKYESETRIQTQIQSDDQGSLLRGIVNWSDEAQSVF